MREQLSTSATLYLRTQQLSWAKGHTSRCGKNPDRNSGLLSFVPFDVYSSPASSHHSALVHKLAEYVSLQFGNAVAHFHGRKLQNEPPSLSTPKGYLQPLNLSSDASTVSEHPANNHTGDALCHNRFPLRHEIEGSCLHNRLSPEPCEIMSLPNSLPRRCTFLQDLLKTLSIYRV